jgi:hypothetical protein
MSGSLQVKLEFTVLHVLSAPSLLSLPLHITERDICRQVTRGIINEQCLACNLAAKSRAPLESISLATQSPALNCWSSLDSVYAGDESTRLNTKKITPALVLFSQW